jgi:predicted nucleotidyltransferase
VETDERVATGIMSYQIKPSPGVRPNTGPFASEEGALTAVVGRLVESLDPAAIYLFGSRARGDARADSDFDLLVVTRDQDGDAAFDYDRAYAPLLGLGVGCDVVPCPEYQFEAEKERPTSLCHVAFRQGRKLYERR